jgi:Ca2+-binding RTX toxin-like protein
VREGSGYNAAGDVRGVSGIFVTGAAGAEIAVTDNLVQVSTAGADGIFVMSGDATVTGNTISGTHGGFVAWNAYGPLVFTGNTITGTTADTIRILTSSLNPTVVVEDNTVAGTAPMTFQISGDATLEGGAGNDVMTTAGFNGTFDGGNGTDTAVFLSETEVDLDAGTAIGATGTISLTSVENVTGGSGNDTLRGDAGNNLLEGGGGDDVLAGRGGNDTLNGGDGIDTADFSESTGGVFANLVLGVAFGTDAGNNVLISIENLTGGAGNDALVGADGGHVLDGGAGNDTLTGGAGADTLIAGSGNNVLNGGAGIDIAVFDQDWAAYTITQSGAVFTLSDGTFTTTATNIEQFDFNGTLFDAADLLNVAPDAPDFADVSPEVDENEAGAVITTFTASDSNSADVLSASVDDTRFEVIKGVGNVWTLQLKATESLDFEAEPEVEVEVTITDAGGLTSSKTLTITVKDINEPPGSGAGLAVWTPDPIAAGTNMAALSPAAGVVDPEGDTLTYEVALLPDEGVLLLEDVPISVGDILTEAQFAALRYTAGNTLGTFTAQFIVSDAEFDEPLTLAITVGAASNLTVTGTAGADTLYGAAANDTLIGLAGDDLLFGGNGNDTLIGGLGADTLNGGEGRDEASYEHAASAVTVSLVTGGSLGEANGDVLISIENLRGSAFRDRLTGDDGNNILNGMDDNDILFGGLGNDTLRGSRGNDTLVGGEGADELHGGSGIDEASYEFATSAVVASLVTGGSLGEAFGDTFIMVENLRGSEFNDTLSGDAGDNVLNGMDGDDYLSGGAGHDILRGSRGADTLEGGAGNDTLNGGSGADVFVFANGFGNDVVESFQNGLDKFDFAAHTLVSGFADLSISADGVDALIGDGAGNSIRVLNGAGLIDATDFLF